MYVSIVLRFCLSCSDADRVNFTAVADLKDPLVAKVSEAPLALIFVLFFHVGQISSRISDLLY